MVYKYGSMKLAAKNITSEFTGRPMTYIGLRDYLKRHGYKIVFGPYLLDNDGNVVYPKLEEITENNENE